MKNRSFAYSKLPTHVQEMTISTNIEIIIVYQISIVVIEIGVEIILKTLHVAKRSLEINRSDLHVFSK